MKKVSRKHHMLSALGFVPDRNKIVWNKNYAGFTMYVGIKDCSNQLSFLVNVESVEISLPNADEIFLIAFDKENFTL